MAWAEYGACPITVGVDGTPPPRPKDVPEGAWVANIDDAPADAIRVDRSTDWGNPFKIGRDGDRADVIRKHEAWLRGNPDLMARLPELRGKTLTCHCFPLPCHAETLAKYANATPQSANPTGTPLPLGQPASVPIPAPTRVARVWRPADTAPVRIMVTGSRNWSDTQRLGDALSWAVRNARITYPGRRIELVHGGARGADSMAADYWQKQGIGGIDEHPVTSQMWQREGKGAGHARNQRMVTTRPHMVLAFDKDGSPGTASAIRMAREAGLPVYAFHDTQGITSHTAYPGTDNPDAAQLTDATEATYAMYEQDEATLGYHNPTIPFRGINRELQRSYFATEPINGQEVHLPQFTPPKHVPITDPAGYETHLADTAYAAEPDWAFWAQSRPNLSRHDHRHAPYTDAEVELAGAVWAEDMDDFIQTLTHRARQRNNSMWTYDTLTMMDSPLVSTHAADLGKEIDTWIRDRRLIERGVTPEPPPKPNVAPRRVQQVDEVQLRRDAAARFEEDNGRPPAARNPDDMAALEQIKTEIRGPDVAVRVRTDAEVKRAKRERWERYAKRGGGMPPRTKLSNLWPELSPAERRREINSAKFRGIILDEETGERIGTGPATGQRHMAERDWEDTLGDRTYVDSTTGQVMPVSDYVGDPNEAKVYTNEDDAPPEFTTWRDPLDSDPTAAGVSQPGERPLSPYQRRDMAEQEFEKMHGRPPRYTVERDPTKEKPDRRVYDEEDAEDMASIVSEMDVEQADRLGTTDAPARGITAESAPQSPYVDSGEITPTVTGAANERVRPRRQVSFNAQRVIQQAIDEWPKHSKTAPPKVTYPDRPGLDAYTAKDAEVLRRIIVDMLKRTGGLG